ncbi:hypothetical protein [Pseudodesulfovibrio tunisiensis]|nr:hypothetical protein [Pseudodesulfovibrio tunisiensis]
MKGFRNFCQHVFNPLHVFCRLRQVGFSGRFARRFCRMYERNVYRFMI